MQILPPFPSREPPTALLKLLIYGVSQKQNMQKSFLKLGWLSSLLQRLYYFKRAEVCTRKHFQKSAHIVDIKSLLSARAKGLATNELPPNHRDCAVVAKMEPSLTFKE